MATQATEIRVDAERLKQEILELAQIGRDEETGGIYRMAFTDEDMKGREWLRQRIEEADLSCEMDGAGNIIAKYGPEVPQSVIVGSHIDTVPCAGALDGTLGVIAGLEAIRQIKRAGLELAKPIELISFSDEEGRFGGMFGSQALCGMITPETLHHASDLDGIKLADELSRHGMDPFAALSAQRRPESIDSYLELHIEQGPVLSHGGYQAGIVEDITGLFKWQVQLHGEANHAGTTPMDMRKDAFMGLADFAHELPRILEENGSERSRATIGKAQIRPGSANTVPGLVEFSIDIRDTDPTVIEELKDACRKALSAIARRRKLMFDFEEMSHIPPVACNKSIHTIIQQQAGSLGLKHCSLPSGAAHDAQIIGQMAPMCMIFAPSKDGQSHSPAEWTAWEDIEACANLVLHSLIELATSKS